MCGNTARFSIRCFCFLLCAFIHWTNSHSHWCSRYGGVYMTCVCVLFALRWWIKWNWFWMRFLCVRNLQHKKNWTKFFEHRTKQWNYGRCMVCMYVIQYSKPDSCLNSTFHIYIYVFIYSPLFLSNNKILQNIYVSLTLSVQYFEHESRGKKNDCYIGKKLKKKKVMNQGIIFFSFFSLFHLA